MLLYNKSRGTKLIWCTRKLSSFIQVVPANFCRFLILKMGCNSSKSTDVVVVPMPKKLQQNLESKENKQEKEDSLRGSQASLTSSSDASRSDRETSAKSTRTTDSGVGELEDDNIITENSSPEKIHEAKVEERPVTSDLTVNGTTITRRKKSPLESQVSFSKEINNNSTSIIERPQSRGGIAFDVIVYPDTGNIKRRPIKLQSLEKKKRKTKRRTKDEISNKLDEAMGRRKEHNNKIIEKATLSRKERQLREARALDEFAQRQTSMQEST